MRIFTFLAAALLTLGTLTATAQKTKTAPAPSLAPATAAPATTTGPIAAGFVPIVCGSAPGTTVSQAAAPAIEVRLAGAVVRVVSGLDDSAQLTAVLRAIRASASRK